MNKLNKTKVKQLILLIKKKVNERDFKINTFRAIKEFLTKNQNEIYEYNNLYIIRNTWIYDLETPKHFEPLPNTMAFCGFTDDNDDRYHYYLQDKKILKLYGITYKDYKNFNSINSFINNNGDLYINNKFYKKIEE